MTKTNTTNVDTFKSPDFACLGYIADRKVYFCQAAFMRHDSKTEFNINGTKTLPRVEVIYGHGNRALVDAAVKAGASGIINAGSGDGSVF